MKKMQRTCIGCNIKKNKNELIRIVLDKEGNVFIDETGKANGRGAYMCDNIECMEKAINSKRLGKSFNVKLDENLHNRIRGVIIERKGKKRYI